MMLTALLGTTAAAAVMDGEAVPLSVYQGQQLTVGAIVAGKPRTFLFDTGEGLTMISPALAQALGCDPWGNRPLSGCSANGSIPSDAMAFRSASARTGMSLPRASVARIGKRADWITADHPQDDGFGAGMLLPTLDRVAGSLECRAFGMVEFDG